MKTIGIICEYNPFHNGHAHQLHTLATKYPDVLRICIMSGLFVTTWRTSPFLKIRSRSLGYSRRYRYRYRTSLRFIR